MSFLIHWIIAFAAWLWDAVSTLALECFKALLEGLATVLQAIPAPGFMADAASYIGSIPPLMAYLASSLQLGAGLTIIVTAYIVRFVIRRIPFIG